MKIHVLIVLDSDSNYPMPKYSQDTSLVLMGEWERDLCELPITCDKYLSQVNQVL